MSIRRMAMTVAMVAALLAVGSLVVAGEDGEGTRPEKPKPTGAPAARKPVGPRLAGIWAKLDLTEVQRAKYAELDGVRAAKVKELNEKIKALQEEVKAAVAAFTEGMTAVLTDEQKAKMLAIQDEERKRAEEKRQKAGERPGAGTTKEPKPNVPVPALPEPWRDDQ